MANDDTAGGSADRSGADAEASAAIARAARGSIAGGDAQNGVRTADHEQAYARASEASGQASGEKASHAERDVFRVTEPAEAVPPGAIDADRFFENGYDTVLQPMVEWVVEREGPILDAVLARRIARAHGFQRTGGRIQERVEALARRRYRMTEEASGTFYWPDDLPPSSNVAFRRPAGEDNNRGVEEVCEAELTSLARAVLSRGFDGQDALISMARELGLQRLREASRGRLEDALQRAKAS
jgi:hypothetical protein